MINKEVLEVLEDEFKAIKGRVQEDLCERMEGVVNWVLNNSYRHVVVSEIDCWLEYVRCANDKLSQKTLELIKQINSKVYDGLGLLDGVISYWIMSEIMTFDMDTLEDIMAELLKDVGQDDYMKGGE